MNHNDTRWVCYARPVALHGRRCGHINTSATRTCAECGCAWEASEDRREAAEAIGQPQRAQHQREARRLRRRRREHAPSPSPERKRGVSENG